MPALFLLVLFAAIGADTPAEPLAPARVIEGKPLTVTVTGDAAGAGPVPKVIQLRVVDGEAVGQVIDGAGAPARKVPFIGVVTTPLAPAVRAQTELGEDIGLFVDAVAPDSPAAKAGVERFDILARYGDQLLCAPVQLSALVKRTGAGNSATLTVIRRGKEMALEVTVGEQAVTATVTVDRVMTDFAMPQAGLPAIVAGQPLDASMLARLREQAERQRSSAAVQGSGAGAAPGAAEPFRNWILVNPATTSQSQSTSVFSNDQGQVIHREIDGVRTITILDAEGKQQYAGPWGGEGDLEQVPEDLRGRVEDAAERRAQVPGVPLPGAGR